MGRGRGDLYIVLEKSSWVPSNLYSFSLKWFSLLLLFSRPVVSNSLRLHGQQHTKPLFPSPSPEVCPSSCPLHRWCRPAILSLTPLSPVSLNLSEHQELFQWVSCLHQMTKILELQLRHQSFQWLFRVNSPWDWLV